MARQICNEEQAREFIKEMAEAYPHSKSKDMDALISLGDADLDTILEGYLYDHILSHMEATGMDIDEDIEELVTNALVDYYIDMLDEEEV